MNLNTIKSQSRFVLFVISVVLLGICVSRSGMDSKLSSRIVEMETLIDSMSKLMLVETRAPEVFFNEEKLFYEESTHTYYYSLKEGSDSALDPRVRVETVREDAETAFTSEITAELIESNTPILFCVYNDTGYEMFYLRCTTLPILSISCESDDIGSQDQEMYLTLFDNREGATRRFIASEGTIHKRGGTSAAHPKVSYKLSLRKNSIGGNKRTNGQPLLGMRQDDDWILYAGYSDQEKIRNVFSQNLWYESCRYDNGLNRSTGTEYQYVEMFLNGKYHGLYALCYPIDEKEMELNGDHSEQALYKYVGYSGDEVVPNEYGRIGSIEVKFPGGGWDQTDEMAKYGQLADSGDFDLLYEYLDFLNSHRDDNEALAYGVDLQNALDITLFLNLIQGEDQVGFNDMKNVFLALFKDKKGIKGLFAPWDMDITWGCSWDSAYKNNIEAYIYSPEDNFILNCGYFSQMIKNDEETYNLLLSEKYEILRHGAWSDDRIFEMLDEYEADIFGSGAFLRDMERWPDGSFEEPQIKLSRFKEYVSKRMAYCDSFYGIDNGT